MNKTYETDLIIKRIRSFCNEELTPYRISKNSGMHPSTLNNILNGTFKDIRLSTLINICNGLDISLMEFFNDDLFTKKR
ncbi:MAG: helix-turn-helix transcriptional regulator [Mycoplasmatota bacterium]